MTTRPLNVCIATSDIVGPIRNGGIGTWYGALARALADAGHRVTVLYCLGTWCENQTLEHWQGWYGEKNIEFVPLPAYDGGDVAACLWVKTAYEVYLWLTAREQRDGRAFDVVHFHEWRGHGFYALLAKRQGLAFRSTVFCTGTHSPLLWHKFGMAEYITNWDEVQADFLERQTVALADVVVSPSRHMLEWITGQGWKLPGRVEIRQYIQGHYLPAEAFAAGLTRGAVKELVFFGRLETRKGLALFCDAIDRLAPTLPPRRLEGEVTAADAAASWADADGYGTIVPPPPAAPPARLKIAFLGKRSFVNGIETEPYLRERAQRWGIDWEIIDTLDHVGAIAYLRGPGRLAVIASLLENSPNTVLECLANQVPCLCTEIGGNRELIDEADRDRITFPLRPQALADKLAVAIRDGMVPARPAIHPDVTKRQWLDWHERIVGEITPARPADERFEAAARLPAAAPAPAPAAAAVAAAAAAAAADLPLVSVCISHRNRPAFLAQALDSIRAQDYPRLEVVIVDDGSANPDAVAYLDSLEEEFARRDWQIVRQGNKYLGAARNHAARRARGEFILFMDDDNFAKPHEVSTFVRCALFSGADVLTCPFDAFVGDGTPDRGDARRRWLPLGASAATGVFSNLFGDANALIRKSAFEALGGFTEDFGIGHEDWELYAKAVLQGYDVMVVPEPLFWYRVDPASMLRTTNHFANHMRSLRPYLEALPGDLRTVLEYAQGMFFTMLAQVAPGSVPASALPVQWHRPALTEPSAVAAEVAPAAVEPEPAPAPVEPPVGVEPAPVGVEPAPVGVEPAPVGVEPAAVGVEPAAVAPSPEPEPEPVAAAPEPVSAEAMPVEEPPCAEGAAPAAVDPQQQEPEPMPMPVGDVAALNGHGINGNGDPAAYQRLVDEYWDSISWRVSAPIRNALLAVRGLPPVRRPIATNREEADRAVESIRNSISWEAAGVLRVMGRVVNRARGKGERETGRQGDKEKGRQGE